MAKNGMGEKGTAKNETAKIKTKHKISKKLTTHTKRQTI
jgi:hypothetical protein